MMRIYLSFRHENDDEAEGHRVTSAAGPSAGEPDDRAVASTSSRISPGGGGPKAVAG
jgi:hypothetical protein